MFSLWQGIQQYELYNKYPELFKRLEQVEAEVAGGTTAVIALVRGPQLYIANVGQSSSISCLHTLHGIITYILCYCFSSGSITIDTIEESIFGSYMESSGERPNIQQVRSNQRYSY